MFDVTIWILVGRFSIVQAVLPDVIRKWSIRCFLPIIHLRLSCLFIFFSCATSFVSCCLHQKLQCRAHFEENIILWFALLLILCCSLNFAVMCKVSVKGRNFAISWPFTLVDKLWWSALHIRANCLCCTPPFKCHEHKSLLVLQNWWLFWKLLHKLLIQFVKSWVTAL